MPAQSGDRWYAKWRDGAGRQHQRSLGRAWTRRGRPPAGYLTKRSAEAALDSLLDQERFRAGLGISRGDVSFEEAADEWYRHGEHERQLKRSTLRGYRSILDAHLIPGFGSYKIDDITPALIEAWRREYLTNGRCVRSMNKILTCMHGVFERSKRAYGLGWNPVALVESREPTFSGEYDWFSPEEVAALVRAAADEYDAAIYATAAMTGLRRGELLALHWRDIDFTDSAVRVRGNLSYGEIVAPKSGKVRVVPMVPPLAERLAQLWTSAGNPADYQLLFPGDYGGFMDGSALRRRYHQALTKAKLRKLPFHSLRHHFGSIAINRASLVQVQAWMGHSDIRTTMRYLHHRSQVEDAALLADAFHTQGPDRGGAAVSVLGPLPSHR